MGPQFNIHPTVHQLSQALAANLMDFLHKTQKSERNIFLALSGGNTPTLFFKYLADYQDDMDDNSVWSRVHFFWADERCVPPDHKDSNFGMAYDWLFKRLGTAESRLHRIKGENDPSTEVKRYTDEIRRVVPFKNGVPQFDWIFLGIGEDGHTASIFPDRPDLIDTDQVCALVKHPLTGQHRITLTCKPINNACKIIFLVTGTSKRKIVREIKDKSNRASQYPAWHIAPYHGMLEWYLDKAAAEYIL